MTTLWRLTLLAGLLWATHAWAATTPWIGYAYPAGGQQGQTFQVTLAGQVLRNPTTVYVSGAGVSATIIQYEGPYGLLTREQFQELAGELKDLRDRRVAEAAGLPPPPPNPKRPAGVMLPDFPDLRNLDQDTPAQLKAIADKYLGPTKKARVAPLAERVIVQMTIDPAAEPGDRELRVQAQQGLSNPLIFQVGTLPEVLAQKPNGPHDPPQPTLDLPVVINGQILPGGVDRFRVRARQSQKLVFQAQARHLDPYLADAVPGWFQATLALYDAQGHEVAYDDDYRFDPDPVIFYEVPESGEYVVEIKDALYRGREDFVYRITAGELPFVTSIFPLGAQAGTHAAATVTGWNLPGAEAPLDTTPGGDSIRYLNLGSPSFADPLPYQVSDFPEVTASGSHATLATAQPVTLPTVVNGRLEQPGEFDVYRFQATAGQQVVAEVYARRLGSPVDSLLRLMDATGKVLAWNDDAPDPESGLLTHHADSYLMTTLPAAGTYYVQMSDAQRHGGPDYGYRLYLRAPQPDFALRVTPSSLVVPTGRAALITVYAIRKDGFTGDIQVTLADAPPGFSLSGGTIPASRDHIDMTLTAPQQQLDQPAVVRLAGAAQIDGATVSHPAVPADDRMQAFAYHHLVPAQDLLVDLTGPRRAALNLQLVQTAPLRLPVGGSVEVDIRTRAATWLLQQGLQIVLNDPPPGVSVGAVTGGPAGLAVQLQADAATAKAGTADNLILEAFIQVAPPARPNAPATVAPVKRRVSLGLLPAVPFEIVQP
jgi:hypothetical protein